jgi:fatty acid desaturase
MQDYKLLFEELKAEVKAAGLYKRATTRGIIEMILIVSGVTIIFTTARYWNPVLLALFITIIFTRAVFLSHDLLHRQIFKDKSFSKRITLPFSNLLLGLSAGWWDWKHNVRHHTYTNCVTKDPDITALDGIFMNSQGDNRLINRFPHLLFWIALMFMYPAFIVQSVYFIFKNKRWGELFITALHWPLFYGGLFYASATTTDAWITIAVLWPVLGTWLALGFITNHLGCEVLSEEQYNKTSWMDLQIRTSRNLKSNLFVHWIFGGLDTQIEHHLFPKASRFNLLKVAKLTEAFCKKHDIYYHETSVIGAFVEIDKSIEANRRK